MDLLPIACSYEALSLAAQGCAKQRLPCAGVCCCTWLLGCSAESQSACSMLVRGPPVGLPQCKLCEQGREGSEVGESQALELMMCCGSARACQYRQCCNTWRPRQG